MQSRCSRLWRETVLPHGVASHTYICTFVGIHDLQCDSYLLAPSRSCPMEKEGGRSMDGQRQNTRHIGHRGDRRKRKGSEKQHPWSRQCDSYEAVCLPNYPCKLVTVLCKSHSLDNQASKHILINVCSLIYINRAQRSKEQNRCVFYATREAELQFLLPSKDSSFTERQLAQLGTIVFRLLRLRFYFKSRLFYRQ